MSSIIFLSLVTLVAGWGSLGHRTVAYLAALQLNDGARHWTANLLNGQDISEAALFPDKVVHMPSFQYTAKWHYIDAQDDPPRVCSINITRDCSDGGCVVSAIANHTGRVVDYTLAHAARGQSMRFVLHFFGDIHQPLHTENEDRGGNEIPVHFDGRLTNLHSVWDTLIPKKHAGGENETQAAMDWARRLYQPNLNHDECVLDAATCALEWASEANQLVCAYVLRDDKIGLPTDLGGEYFEMAVPIVEEQIRRAGRRLAAWINDMADASHRFQVQS